MRYFEKEFRDEMYIDNRYMIDNPELPSCVICDLDGTLAIHKSGRSAFEYDRVDEDSINISLRRTLEQFNVPIIFFTGRENTGKCKEKTIKWLEDNGFKNPILYMRKNKDFRPDDIVKYELYLKYIKDKYNVIGIFDDRDKVVNMWRENGLPCYQVYPGHF